MTQYSRYGSAKGTTWAYWERIKSVWKRLWVPLSSHVTGIWDSCTLIVLSIRDYILFIVPLSRFHYRPIQFQECGVRHTWGLPRTWQKMMQWPRCTPVPELKQWNTPLLSCSWKPPKYGGRSDIIGSFRLQSTCRYQRSREDVCPQHKATGHVSKYVNSRCAIENCLMSARNIRATAHAPCSQHTFNRNLELKTDQFHGVYRLVTPST